MSTMGGGMMPQSGGQMTSSQQPMTSQPGQFAGAAGPMGSGGMIISQAPTPGSNMMGQPPGMDTSMFICLINMLVQALG